MYDMYFILSNIIDIELKQCIDEGRDCSVFIPLITELKKIPKGQAKEDIAESIYHVLRRLPMSAEVEKEPCEWEMIQKKLTNPPAKRNCILSEEEQFDRILGAWQGRCVGYLLGKSVNRARTHDESDYLNVECGTFASLSSILEDTEESFLGNESSLNCQSDEFQENILNYTVLALILVEKNGQAFSRLDWADNFVRNLVPEDTFTSERIAYRNLLDQIFPPDTAWYRNPYREWNGAQTRADLYGYISPGDPMNASYMAWKDASITHVKSGIYSAMWIAASLALAFTMPADQAVRESLKVIPDNSRLFRALNDAISDFDRGMQYKTALRKLRDRWHEEDVHHCCHAIPNALIVLNAIMYGQNDMEKTLSMAVLSGFDTSCNSAAAGSILGLSIGANMIDEKWKEPLQNRLSVSLTGVESVSLEELARRTLKQIHV